MKQPFSLNMPFRAPPPSHNNMTPSHIGGAAPGTQTQGVRRDFQLTPQFHPSLTVVGGLKPPVRG